MADTYGGARLVIERQPIKDVRVGLSIETNLWPAPEGQQPKESKFGIKISLGSVAPVPRQLSPCTISKDIFAAN